MFLSLIFHASTKSNCSITLWQNESRIVLASRTRSFINKINPHLSKAAPAHISPTLEQAQSAIVWNISTLTRVQYYVVRKSVMGFRPVKKASRSPAQIYVATPFFIQK